MKFSKTLLHVALPAMALLCPSIAAAALKTLHSFTGGSDGGNPVAALIYVKAKGLLYGTTPNIGGMRCSPNCGTVFSLDPKSQQINILHTFGARADGSNPQAALIDIGGVLYGTTAAGGPYGQGTVFKIDTTQTPPAYTILHSFTGGTDGAVPVAPLTQFGAQLVGTTMAGGSGSCAAAGCGTAFKIDPETGTEVPLYAFQGGNADGRAPMSNLVNVSGLLYGTTSAGGSNATGTTFSLNFTTQKETVLSSFQGNVNGGEDGGLPQGALITANGSIFGSTQFGGGNLNCSVIVNGMQEQATCGAVFSLQLSNSQESIVGTFNGGCPSCNGSFPTGGLCVHRGASIVTGYGATPSGGPSNDGTLYSVNLADTNQSPTALYNFLGGSDGAAPVAGVIYVNGILYGVTSSGGGTGNYGTIFMFKP